MDTSLTLLLAGAISALVALNTMGVATLAVFVDTHIKDAGIALLGLALVTLVQGALVRRLAFYVALLGALYLLAVHWEEISNVL